MKGLKLKFNLLCDDDQETGAEEFYVESLEMIKSISIKKDVFEALKENYVIYKDYLLPELEFDEEAHKQFIENRDKCIKFLIDPFSAVPKEDEESIDSNNVLCVLLFDLVLLDHIQNKLEYEIEESLADAVFELLWKAKADLVDEISDAFEYEESF